MMFRRFTRSRRLVMLLGLCLLLTTQVVGHQISDPTAAPVRFIRVYAPMEKIEQSPTKLLPMDRAEFERHAMNLKPETIKTNASRPRIVRAEYSATLQGESLIDGHAMLQIDHPQSEKALLKLSPWSMATNAARWQATKGAVVSNDKDTQNKVPDDEEPDVGEAQRDATLGVDASGRLNVVVDTSGRLDVLWSLRCQSGTDERLLFTFDVPACPANVLTLKLPNDRVPYVEGAVITEIPPDPSVLPPSPDSLWRIALGGRHRGQLMLGHRSAALRSRRLTFARQTNNYELLPRGVNVTSEISLDIHREPLRRLRLATDPQLRVVSIRYGTTDVPWNVSTDDSSITLTFPEPIQGTNRVITVSAITPLETDRPWQLPKIYPTDLSWQEGIATVTAREPLSLDGVDVVDGQQTTALTDGSLTLRYFDPQATVSLRIGFRKNRPQLSCATAIDIDNETTMGRVVTELRMEQGHRSRVEATVNRGWNIDTVASSPEGSVINWYVESSKGQSRLKVLFKPIRAGEPRRIVVTGRHRGLSPGDMADAQQLTMRQLKMVHFTEVDVVRQLVSVATGSRFRLRLKADEQLARLDPRALNDQDALLLAGHDGELVFLENEQASNLAIGIELARPQFHGQLGIEVIVGEQQLAQSTTIECTPNDEPLDHVVVHFSHAQRELIRWSIPSESEDAFTARRVTRGEQIHAGLDPSGETWRIELKRPRRSRFTILAQRASSFTSKQPVSLAVLPEATSQTGRVSVRIAPGGRISINNRRLAPLMPPHERHDEFASLRAAYRYDPLADAASGNGAAIWLVPTTSPTPSPMAWAYDCRLQTILASDGSIRYSAVYAIENAGRQTVAITMPSGIRLEEARIDGVTAVVNTVDASQQEAESRKTFTLELLEPLRFPTLSLHYAPTQRHGDDTDAQLRQFSQVAPLAPEIDIPILSRSWTCWVPPGYQLLNRRATTPPRMTWSQRLFGPLGRAAGESPFDLFSPAHYAGRSPHAQEIDSLGEQVEATLEQIDRIAQAHLASQTDSVLTWGQLLSDAVPQVLVDRAALSDLGISPQSAVAMPNRSNRAESTSGGLALTLIERAGMTLLVQPGAIVLTSVTQTRLGGQQTTPLRGLTVGNSIVTGPLRLLPGVLADRVEHAARFGDDSGYLTTKAWNALGDGARGPWPMGDFSNAALAGWSVYRVNLDGAAPVEGRVIRIAFLQMFAWCLGLIFATLLWTRLGNRTTPLLTIAGAASTVALLTPASYAAIVPIFSGILLGMMLALLLRALTPRPFALLDSAYDSTRSHKVSFGQAVGVFLLVTTVVATIHGQETQRKTSHDATKQDPTEHKALSTSKPYRVFFPIDAEKNPVGDKVYVPETLYEQMLRRSTLHQHEPRGVLVESAIYRAMLDWKADRTQLDVVDMSTKFNVQVFDATSEIRLPLAENSADASADPAKLESVYLNGRRLDAMAYRWQGDRRALLIPNDQLGKHRITLTWQPRLTKDDPSTGFDLNVARLTCATVVLRLPADAPMISIPTCLGQITRNETLGRLTADLGPCDRLSVGWPEDAVPSGERRIEIDQLLLLDVQPGSVHLTDRIKYRVIDGIARQIVLQVDPRLRLLPFDADSPVKSTRSLPGEPSSVVLELADPTQKQGVIDANFLMEGTHGVGKLRLPHIGEQTSQLARRWLAVVADPTLKVDVPTAEGVEPIAPAEFRNLWGSPLKQPPKLAYRLTPEEVDWSMSSRRVQPHTLVDQTLSLRFDRRKLRYAYQADLMITSGHALRYRVVLPRKIEVDQVMFKNAEDAELVTHWRHHKDDSLTLFLREPATGNNRLTITAHRTIDESGRMPLAVFEIQGTETQQRRFRLVRGEGALLTVENLKGVVNISTAREDNLAAEIETTGAAISETNLTAEKIAWRDDDRLIADLVANRPRFAATLIYSPNEPKIDATAVTSMRRDDGNWTVRFDYQVKITDGLVDQLRFILPPQWKGLPTFDSSPDWHLEQVPGQLWRRFIIRFDKPIQGNYRLSFEGQVAQSTELRVPLVRPLGASALQHFLVLPTQINQRPIAWNRRRLIPGSLPQGFEPSGGPFTTYLVGENAEVTLDSETPPSGVSRVLLADMHVKWDRDNTCNGVAIFDLQPAGRSFCLLKMPRSLQIVQASIEGVAALLAPTDQGTWRIPLVSRQHPQRISVLFQGTIESSARGSAG